MKLAAQLLVAALLAWLAASTGTQAGPQVDPAALIAKYGPPDRQTRPGDDSTRPPVLLLELEYAKEGVRFLLQADAPADGPPSSGGWRLLMTTDPYSGRHLLPEEVEARMKARLLRAPATASEVSGASSR